MKVYVDQFLSPVPSDEQETGEIEQICERFWGPPFSVNGERNEEQEEEEEEDEDEDEEDCRYKFRKGKEVNFLYQAECFGYKFDEISPFLFFFTCLKFWTGVWHYGAYRGLISSFWSEYGG